MKINNNANQNAPEELQIPSDSNVVLVDTQGFSILKAHP